MSQFGTMHNRMHPCVSHPSCEQFYAKDILLAMEPKAGPFRLGIIEASASSIRHTHLTHLMSESNIGGEDNSLQDSIIGKKIDQTQTAEYHSTQKHSVDYTNREYVEVSPGVWSYKC